MNTAALPSGVRIPIELTERPQFVLWKYETRKDKSGGSRQTKVPCQRSGRRASSTNPSTWCGYPEAIETAARDRRRFAGIGFVFTTNDPFCGVDLDNCLNEDGTIKPWAAEILASLPGAYTEVSPSGKGLKVWVRARLTGTGKQIQISEQERIEIYDAGRFFTVTGNSIGAVPERLPEHQEAIGRLYATPRAAGDLDEAHGNNESRIYSEGQRHRAIRREAARQAHRSGGNVQKTLEATLAFNLAHCRPAKDPKEVESLVTWMCARERKKLADVAPRSGIDLLKPGCHDSGNAERLQALYGENMRYCHALKKWLVWAGTHWTVDESGRAEKLAKLTMVEFLRQATQAGNEAVQKFARGSLESKRINGLLAMAKCELPVSTEELDTHAMLLNFQNGTVDLHDGSLLPHRREDFITKIIEHDYIATATCPLFLQVVNRVMGVHPDASEGELERADRMVAYIQRAVGYSLTGTTREKAVFFLHGGGCNGKTTLLAIFLWLLKGYSTILQVDSLMVSRLGETANTSADLADLRGARFAMTSETEAGQRIAEGKLKRLTQGMGQIKATRKYENPIVFPETHKLWIDGNHKPIIRGTDAAIWDRLHLVPFNVTIPAEEVDPELHHKLRAEAEGILAWAVAGCLQWHREGLGRPPEIEQARNEWREECDPLADFIADTCVVAPKAACRIRDLWSRYTFWAASRKETHRLERGAFKDRLRAMGIREVQHRFEKGSPERAWVGIGIIGEFVDVDRM